MHCIINLFDGISNKIKVSKPLLSNERLFFINLYNDGVGEMIVGKDAVKSTIHKYVNI